MEAERAERDRQRQEEIDAQNKSFLAMKKMAEEGKAKRIQEYGEDVEPVYSEELEGLRANMMAKIEQVPLGEPIHNEKIQEFKDAPSVRAISHLSIDGNILNDDDKLDVVKGTSNQKEEIQNLDQMVKKSEFKDLETSTGPLIEEIVSQDTLIEELTISQAMENNSMDNEDTLLDQVYNDVDTSKISETIVTPLFKSASSSVKVTRELLEKIQEKE